MENNETELEKSQEVETGKIRDEQGRFVEGVSGNPNGRPAITEEQKLVKKAIKQFISEHKQSLAEALPAISPVLIGQALNGNILAIKEVHDRVMGKPLQETDLNVTVQTAKDKYGKLD